MELLTKDSLESVVLSENVFNKPFKESLIHQVIVSFQTMHRQGSKSQKSRAEVKGSNKKPWRQKGTGRARAGSVKSPIWRSGGVTFASKPKRYIKKINKKMYKEALRSIFSKLFYQNRLVLLKDFSINNYKTFLLVKKLKDMSIKSVLIILSNYDKNLFLASRNLHMVNICTTRSINPVNLIFFKNIILTIDSLKKIEEDLL
ncbi:50S ribosomal protein L4 [Candidatus Purcelliella pentastirinorum]|uniref:Large ribosomal subunit protein uL4 n=1 Tax=Candidatus Purcelliella pentastirinorum TaxID=472834 RepID=A0AAX3N8X7_9ENTR|nr:50S ribosomal protein L4 [Candidatus Purcelliella pentastirinorum]WDI78562.1 50S ribosomal protein L4 [Candidatus Purcelliella pentastirinorum]WDR80410.1 50S ribosomal protein L4 [Candidatus Purcelliella pentastirinorum]